MTIAQAIHARLSSLSAVTALVGTRIRVLKLRQGDTSSGPAIRIQEIGQSEPMHLRGSVAVFRSRVQVDFVASEEAGGNAYDKAVAVADAAHGNGAGSGLCGFSGAAGTVDIAAILPDMVREGYDPEELRQVRIMRDYMVHWRA